MCFSLGRHPVKGSYTHRLRPDITLVTVLVMPESIVIMGVLNFFGLATLITAFLQPLLRRITAYAGIPVSFLLFLLTRGSRPVIWALRGCAWRRFPFSLSGKLMMVWDFV